MKRVAVHAPRFATPVFLAGIALVVLGFYLPWWRVRPGVDGVVPGVLLFNMNAGLSPGVVPWLLPLVVVAFGVWIDMGGRVSAVLVCIAGLGYAWFPYHQVQSRQGGEVGEVFVAANGVHLASLGGIILLVAGLLYFLRRRRARPHPVGHNDAPE